MTCLILELDLFVPPLVCVVFSFCLSSSSICVVTFVNVLSDVAVHQALSAITGETLRISFIFIYSIHHFSTVAEF